MVVTTLMVRRRRRLFHHRNQDQRWLSPQHESIGPARRHDARAATAYCARMPNCCGMWLKNSREVRDHVNLESTRDVVQASWCLYQIKELPRSFWAPIVATSLKILNPLHSTLHYLNRCTISMLR